MKQYIRRFWHTMACLAGVLASTSALTAAESQPLQRNTDIRYGVLDNGMTYYIWPNQMPKGEAVYRLWLKSGSLNEDNDQLGLAHFLEHMAFNGSQHFPADRMVRFLESKGAKFGKDLNAHTSFDETVYKLQLPSSDPATVDSTLLIMADWAYGLSLDPVEVEKEKGVILSEWIARNNKGSNTNDVLLDVMFENSRYAIRHTIGDTGIVRNATSELLRRYYENWYRPDLMAIAVVGDIDPQQVEQSIHRLFGNWKPASNPPAYKQYQIPAYKKRAVRLATSPGEKKVELDIIRRIESSSPIQTEEDMKGYVLNKMTHALIKRRLASNTFTDQGFSSASMGRTSVVRGGDFWLSSATLDKTNIANSIAQFWDRRTRIQKWGFNQVEIRRVAKEILAQARRAASDVTPRTSTKMMDELYNDYMRQMCCIDPKQELALLEKIVPQIDSIAILRYVQQMIDVKHEHWFLHGDSTLLQQIPNHKKLKKINKLWTGSLGMHFAGYGSFYVTENQVSELMTPASFSGSHLVNTDSIAAIQALHWQLDNGCDVYYRQSDNSSGKLLLTGFREGGLYHLDSTQHMAGVMASAIIQMSGAGNMDNETLKEYLSESSASIRMLIDKNRTGVAGNAHNEDAEQLFQLLYTKWNGARVDSVILQRIQTELQKSDSLKKAVTQQEMLDAFDRLYGSAQGYHFILIGDLPADTVQTLCDHWLGALPSGPKEYRLEQKVTLPIQKDSMTIEHTDKEKATVAMYWEKGIDLQDSTFSLFRHQLMGDMLKGVITSRLRQILREEMGITYNVGVVAGSSLHPVPMWRNGVVCSCLPENTDTIQAVVRRELQLLADSPEVFAATLEDVKQNLLKQHALHIQQNTWWTGYIRNLIYNKEQDWTLANQYPQLVKEITPAQVAESISYMLNSPCMIKISKKE